MRRTRKLKDIQALRVVQLTIFNVYCVQKIVFGVCKTIEITTHCICTFLLFVTRNTLYIFVVCLCDVWQFVISSCF